MATDGELFDIDFGAGQNRDMTREALETILYIWRGEAPSKYMGQFRTAKIPDPKEND